MRPSLKQCEQAMKPLIQYNVHGDDEMTNIENDAKEASDKAQAAAKAAAKKVTDPGRDLDWEYKKEKAKEKLDNL